MDGWKIELHRNSQRIGFNLWASIQQGSKTAVITGFDKAGYPIITEIERGELVKTVPFIPADMMSGLLQAILDTGTKPKDQSYTEGDLAATKIHLEDMRALVFKNGKK